jgi:PhnB protein
MPVQPIPSGYHTITPYLICRGAAKAIAFYEQAFGAKEKFRLPMPGGLLGHAELEFGDSVIMLADENPDWGAMSPQSLGGTPVSQMMYVKEVDTVFQRALDLGAKVIKPVSNQFYGDRSGHLEDPFGHRWSISTHVEDVPPDELERRMKQASDTGCP